MSGELMTDEESTSDVVEVPDDVTGRRAEVGDDQAPALRSPCGRRTLRRRLVRAALATVGVLAVVTAGASIWAWSVSAGHIIAFGDDGDEGGRVRAPVAIVLGAAVHADGQPSPWLAHRLDVAADLYTSGRVEAILVSGDNRRAGYDEPTVMRRYLLSQGIPDQAVAVDYAGFDTYDTCVRARRIFGIERALLVTQDFHEPRAVAICRTVGVSVDGVGDSRARGDRTTWAVSWVRERPATIKAVADVVSRREPTLGRRETSVEEAITWTREHRR